MLQYTCRTKQIVHSSSIHWKRSRHLDARQIPQRLLHIPPCCTLQQDYPKAATNVTFPQKKITINYPLLNSVMEALSKLYLTCTTKCLISGLLSGKGMCLTTTTYSVYTTTTQVYEYIMVSLEITFTHHRE